MLPTYSSSLTASKTTKKNSGNKIGFSVTEQKKMSCIDHAIVHRNFRSV